MDSVADYVMDVRRTCASLETEIIGTPEPVKAVRDMNI